MAITLEERRAKRRAYYAHNRERVAAYRRKSKERISAGWKRYYQRKKGELYEKKRAYMAANPDKVKRWKRADYERHRDAYIRRAARNGRSETAKVQRAIYYRANKELIAARHREYAQRNQIAEWYRLYRLSEKGRAISKASDRRCAARVAAYKAEWARRNRERLSQYLCIYLRERCRSDPAFAMRLRLRSRLGRVIHRYMTGREATAVIDELLGCSWSELMCHLGSKFKTGMSWQNYGAKGWHIDHIKPLCAFDLTDPEQRAVAFHYSNLQPLWALDNMRKGGRWQPEGKINPAAVRHWEIVADTAVAIQIISHLSRSLESERPRECC
jgi:hypothetical protein